MNRNRSPRAGSRGPGEITAALILSLGIMFEQVSRVHVRRGFLAAIPVIGVNWVAFTGQLHYWHAYLPGSAEQFLVAATLESVSIYLAWQAHLSRVADDSAMRLQLSAYLVAAGVGAMNYSHFCRPDWKPTVAAVTFGGASAISPWLWGIHSRRISRDILKLKGLIEDHAVRLGATRWCFHAYRCVRVMWHATWKGENRIAEAIALYENPGPAQPATAPDAPPPAEQRREPPQEPRRAEPAHSAPVRAARPAELAAASEHMQEVALRLAATPAHSWPSQRALAETDFEGSVWKARSAIVLARAKSNGGSGEHAHQS